MSASLESDTCAAAAGGTDAGAPAEPGCAPGAGMERLAEPMAPALVRRVMGHTAYKALMALTDQGVVSGTRFLTTVIIGKYCGKEELGVYSLGFSFVVILAAMQEALLTLPYTLHVHRLSVAARSAFAGSILVFYAVLGLATTALMAGLAGLFSLGIGPDEMASVMGVLTVSILFTQLWDLARRMAFAHLRTDIALFIDAAAAVIQVGGLLALAYQGRLSASSAYIVFGASCLVVGGTWLLWFRRHIAIRRAEILPALQRCWTLGCWAACAQVTSVAGAYVTHWLLAVVLDDMAAVGEYAAALTLVLLSNPLMLGFSNFLAPKMAQALAEGGPALMQRVGRHATLFLTTAMLIFSLTIVLFGRPLVWVLFNRDYAVSQHLLAVLSTSIFTSSLVMAAGNAVMALHRSDLRFYGRLLSLIVALSAGAVLVRSIGVLGAAYSLLLGTVADTIFTYVCYRRLIHQPVPRGAQP